MTLCCFHCFLEEKVENAFKNILHTIYFCVIITKCVCIEMQRFFAQHSDQMTLFIIINLEERE
jgi:hypothetical protein